MADGSKTAGTSPETLRLAALLFTLLGLVSLVMFGSLLFAMIWGGAALALFMASAKK